MPNQKFIQRKHLFEFKSERSSSNKSARCTEQSCLDTIM